MKRILMCFIFLSLLSGCADEPTVRYYEEVSIEPPRKNVMPMDEHHAMLRSMPDDPIHANLKMENMTPAATSRLEASVDRSPIRWETPAGWLENKGSGMRIVTFLSAEETNPVETTIISLGGQAGGLKANVERWMRQIGVEPSSSQNLDAFLNAQERTTTMSGLPVVLIDLSRLQADAPAGVDSMVAAVIDRGQSQIFIKMTGTKQAVRDNFDHFRSLVLSIKDPS